MTYADLRHLAQTGDVLLVRGNTLVRVLSASSFSHVAVLVWMPDGGLWVFEFVEGVGYQAMPASQWFAARKGQAVYHCQAPLIVRRNAAEVRKHVLTYRDGRRIKRRYGWLSLVTVWLSQVTGRRIPVWAKVCSTFAQEVWERAGYTGFTRTADPDDFVEHCLHIAQVREM